MLFQKELDVQKPRIRGLAGYEMGSRRFEAENKQFEPLHGEGPRFEFGEPVAFLNISEEMGFFFNKGS